jgi:predicted dehydrogenase
MVNMSTTAPIRIAIIGAGIISQSIHIPTLQRAGFDLVTVCDLSQSRVDDMTKRLGVTGTIVPEDVIDDDRIDAVLIATPGSHAQLAIAALKSGKHVLAEKPLALNLAEIEELERAAAEAGKVLQIGYMKMYDPLTDRVRKELGELQDVRLVRITVSHPDDSPQIQHLRMKPPANDADGGRIRAAIAYEDDQTRLALDGASAGLMRYYRDVLHGSVIHELSLLRAIGLQVPTSWTAEAFPTLEGPEPASLLATGSVGDVRYVISWNWLPEYPEYDEELKVLAANGRLEYHLAKPYLLEERSRLRVERNVGLERQETNYTQTSETGFLRQLDAFAKSVSTGAAVLANLEGAKADVLTLQALAQAIAASAGQLVVTEAEKREQNALTAP